MKIRKIDNKKGQGGAMVALWIIVALIAVALGSVFFGFGPLGQTFIDDDDDDADVPKGLQGESSQISIAALDAGHSDPTTRAAVPIYVKDTKTGDLVEIGGSATSLTGSDTVISAGIVVQNEPYEIWAFNATWAMFDQNAFSKTVASRATTASLNVMRIPTSLGITVLDKNGAALAGEARNITLGADDNDRFDEFRIENNESNTGIWIFGFFANVPEDSNISQIEIGSTFDSVTAVQGTDSSGSLNLGRTSTDDFSWTLSSPTRLLDVDELSIGPVIFFSDGDGTDIEIVRWNTVDANHFRSSKNTQEVMFGPENDASTPADVGLPDPNFFVGIN